jgi:hypothetical protein
MGRSGDNEHGSRPGLPSGATALSLPLLIGFGLLVIVLVGAGLVLTRHRNAPALASDASTSTDPSTSTVPSTAPSALPLAAEQDEAAQKALMQAVIGAKIIYTDKSTYASAAAELTTIVPQLCVIGATSMSTFEDPGCTMQPSISVFSSRHAFAAAIVSASGTCFWIRDVDSLGMAYGSGSPCTGTAARQASEYEWS